MSGALCCPGSLHSTANAIVFLPIWNRARWHAPLWGWLVFMVPARAIAQTSPKVHELMAAPDTVHRGFFDATLKPVLTIDSGDVVRLHTASGNPRYYEGLGVPKDKIPADLYRVFLHPKARLLPNGPGAGRIRSGSRWR